MQKSIDYLHTHLSVEKTMNHTSSLEFVFKEKSGTWLGPEMNFTESSCKILVTGITSKKIRCPDKSLRMNAGYVMGNS